MEQIPIAIAQLQDFIADYRSFERDLAHRHIVSFKELVSAFEKKQADLSEVLRLNTPNYNLFEVLRIRHYEVKVHTPFLAHLLNPKANHQQSRLFFDSFLKIVFPRQFSIPYIADIKVIAESRNEFGQIDIQVWFREKGVQKAFVIENKIYHHDEDKQLYRYYQYLSVSKRLPNPNLHLIYLTLDGKQPSLNSLGKTPELCVTSISYREHITQWLNNALEKIERNSLHYSIIQYVKTINSL